MTLIDKFCAKLLKHRLRRQIACEVHLGEHFSRTRRYICRVCGEIVREEE